jgi:hypothetical protein
MSTIDPRLKDFRNFLYIVWKHLNLPDPTPLQYDIAQRMETGPDRQIVEAFRGVGKSWIASAFVCHQLLINPTKNILVVSASKNRASDFTTFTLRLINEIPILQHLVPREEQRNSKESFDVGPAPASHAPSVKSVGITGQITGSRADIIIADDIETSANSQTELMRIKLAESVKEFDAVIKPGGRVVFLGTPQTENSLYEKLESRGYMARIWPVRMPNDEQRERYGIRLAPYVSSSNIQSGTTTEPTRFTDEDLTLREASYGRSGFALQFMLDPRLSDVNRYPLKLSDLVVHSLDPKRGPSHLVWCNSPEHRYNDIPNVGFDGDAYYRPMSVSNEFTEYQGSVIAIDPSGRGKDETAYAIVKCLHGQLFLVDIGGFRSGYTMETLETIVRQAKLHGCNYAVYEANFGDGMFGELIKPVFGRIHPCTIEEVKHSSQKEKRIIDTLEPVMNQHRLIVDPRVIEKDYQSIQSDGEIQERYRLFYQMSRITRDRGSLAQDDRLDALAIAVSYWVQAMARDTELAHRQHKQELLEKELDKFMENAIGDRSKRTNSWINV